MTEAEARRLATADRPMLVYIFGDDRKGGKDPRFAIEDERAFRDPKVLVGARFFDCFRLHKADAKKDRALKKYASKAPCLVFVRPNYEATKCLRPKWDKRKIADTMLKTVRKDYGNCVHCTFKNQETIQEEEAALRDSQQDLALLQAEIAEETDASRLALLKKKRDALASRIEKAEAELKKRETKLYELEPKA